MEGNCLRLVESHGALPSSRAPHLSLGGWLVCCVQMTFVAEILSIDTKETFVLLELYAGTGTCVVKWYRDQEDDVLRSDLKSVPYHTIHPLRPTPSLL